jgi:hypothetical protein
MLDFDSNGNLPPGVHECTWEEFSQRFGWNAHRRRLLGGLWRALEALKVAGCKRAYIDGSFVTATERPNDFDACWDLSGVDDTRLDPVLLTFRDGRLAQKTKYFGEMFPAQWTADRATGQAYLNFFQTDKTTGDAKGIVALDVQRLS